MPEAGTAQLEVEMDIEAKKDGIKLSYKRFLADSAPGYVAILLIALASVAPACGSHSAFEPIFRAASNLATQHEHIRDGALLVVFLLGPPLGLLLNATSFMLMRGAHDVTSAFFLRLRLSKGFTLIKAANRFEEAVEQLDSSRFSSLEHVHGVQMMSRTVALVAALAACYLGWPGYLVIGAFVVAMVLRIIAVRSSARPRPARPKSCTELERACAGIFLALTAILFWVILCPSCSCYSGSAKFGIAALGFTVLSSYLRAHALNRVLDIASWIDLPKVSDPDSETKRLGQLGSRLRTLRTVIAGKSAEDVLTWLARESPP